MRNPVITRTGRSGRGSRLLQWLFGLALVIFGFVFVFELCMLPAKTSPSRRAPAYETARVAHRRGRPDRFSGLSRAEFLDMTYAGTPFIVTDITSRCDSSEDAWEMKTSDARFRHDRERACVRHEYVSRWGGCPWPMREWSCEALVKAFPNEQLSPWNYDPDAHASVKQKFPLQQLWNQTQIPHHRRGRACILIGMRRDMR